MGIAKIALDPAPSVKQANVEKSAPNHPAKPLHTHPLLGNAHIETTHLKGGLTLFQGHIMPS